MCGSSNDDFGIGQMQYYPMDSIASQDNQIFSFDVDPDQNRQWNQFLNNASNFMFYHKLGNVACMQKCQNKKNECLQKGTQNFHESGILFMIFGSPSQEVGDLPVVCLQVGFLVYTGAADFDETLPHLEAACAYFAEVQPEVLQQQQHDFGFAQLTTSHNCIFFNFILQVFVLCGIAIFKIACALSWSSDYVNERHISWILFRQLDHFGHEPEVIFLLGHWNNEGLGCTKRMAVPEIHEALMQIPGCSGFGRHEQLQLECLEAISDCCFCTNVCYGHVQFQEFI